MKIAIDGNLISGNKTGMGVVAISVIENWVKYNDCDITVYVPKELDREDEEKIKKSNIRIRKIHCENYFIWEQLILPIYTFIDHPDVLWCPYNTSPILAFCPIVLTVHDVIYMNTTLRNMGSVKKKLALLYRRLIVPISVRKADRIITVSEYSKKEIIEKFPVCCNKIVVIHNGISLDGEQYKRSEKNTQLLSLGINKPYILAMGSYDYRKNSMNLIKAYESLSNDIKIQYALVFFGFKGYRNSPDYKYVCAHGIKQVIFLEYINEELKNQLYVNASIFVFPSLYEGFGIPILEAFQKRTPVIASDVTSIPEVAGNAVTYIDPHNTKNICKAITEVLSDSKKSDEMRAEGLKQLQKFNIEILSKRYYDLLSDYKVDIERERA